MSLNPLRYSGEEALIFALIYCFVIIAVVVLFLLKACDDFCGGTENKMVDNLKFYMAFFCV